MRSCFTFSKELSVKKRPTSTLSMFSTTAKRIINRLLKRRIRLNSIHYYLPFLILKKECEAAGKEVSINEWIREPEQLDVKIAYEESFALVAKIATEKEALKQKKEIQSKFQTET